MTAAAPRRPKSPRHSLTRRVLIRASAGSGKTFQLSSRYLQLLQIAPPDRILATTFTRKAAGEILQRVLTRLAQGTLDEKSRELLGSSMGGQTLTRDDCRQLIASFTSQLHRARIGTLDSYFAQLAGSYALELGLAPGWKISDPTDAAQLHAEAIDALLESSQVNDVIQLMHLLDRDGPARSIAQRMHRAVDELYEVFLGSSASCWSREPPTGLLSDDSLAEVIAALEAFPASGKRMSSVLQSDVAKTRSGDWPGLLKSGLVKVFSTGESTYYNAPIPAPLHQPYGQLLRHCRAMLLMVWHQQTAAARQLLEHFHRHRTDLQQRAGNYGFGDITRELEAAAPDRLLEFRLNSKVSHLLLDEFQDTSPAQWNVLRQMGQAALRDPRGSLFCVGDVKQAIYGWRGGEAGLFDVLESELPDLIQENLDRSRRSSPVIMQVVNQIMTRLTSHPDYEDAQSVFADWVTKFPKHSTALSDLPGYFEFRTTGDHSGDGETDVAATSGSHMEDVADHLQQLAASHPGRSIGVLTRSNQAVGELIFQLQRRGVPASEEGGNPLTDSAAVRLALALLTLADHPGNSIVRFQVTQSPLGSHEPFVLAASESGAVKLAALIRQQLVEAGYAEWLRNLLPLLAPACDGREFRRFTQLIALAEEYDADSPTLRATDFVAHARAQRRQEPSAAAVRVMTIHQSKGLEFDVVVLPELDGELVRLQGCKYVALTPAPAQPPSLVALFRDQAMFNLAGDEFVQARQQTFERLVREALCVLYVALTRARHALHVLIEYRVSAKVPKTSAGLLRSALDVVDGMSPDTVLFELGNSQWDHGAPRAQPVPQSGAQQPSPPVFAPPATARRVKRLLPSHLHEVQSGRALRLTLKQAPAMFRGAMLHACLEQMTWLTDEPSHESCTQLIRSAGIPAGDVDLLARQLAEILQRPSLRQLFSESAARQTLQKLANLSANQLTTATVQVSNEWRFTQSVRGSLLSGSIDRLVALSVDGRIVAAEIIDFKSDDLGATRDRLAERVDAHREQLVAYREFFAEHARLPPQNISIQLAFLQTGDVVEVT